jgi:hypothetical protein
MVPFHWLVLNASQTKSDAPFQLLKPEISNSKTDPYKVSDMDEADVTILQVMLSF